MNKKSQIRMTETIGIIIIFFILIVFGLIFYSNYQKSAFIKQKNEVLEKNAVSTALRITYLQELNCETSGGQEERLGSCIDLYKLRAAKQVFEDNDYYSDLFSSTDVFVNDLVNDKTYSIYNSTPQNYTARKTVSTPVLLRDVTVLKNSNIIKKDYFGVLNVHVYQ